MLMCQCANWLHYHAERHIGILFNWHIGTLLIVTLFIYEEDTVCLSGKYMSFLYGRRGDASLIERSRTGKIDSAGILAYHEGELPDSRIRAHAARRGYKLVHRSRPVRTEDFYNFDLIIGMDDRNIDDLQERAPGVEEQKKIHRMTEYCRRIPADHVPDPYYGGAEGFEYVLDILEDACSGLLEKLGC